MKIKFTKIATVFASLFIMGNSLTAQTLDQSQTDIADKTSLSDDVYGQSFTSAIAGKLSSIDLYIWNYQNTSAQISLKVFETDVNGFPTGTVIATSNVVPIGVTTAWITFPFSGCTNLKEGVKYAFIEDWGPSVPLIDDINWHHSNINTNPYAGGHSFKSPGHNTTSYYAITFDFAFKVFMEGQAAPTAASYQNLCPGTHLVSELTATAESGATLNWYNAFTSNMPLTGSETVVSGPYWVSQTKNCVEGTRLQITADQTSPATPTVSANQIFKKGATYANLDAVGTNLKWHTAATGGSTIALTNTVTDNSTAYVSQSTGICESVRAMVNLKEISDSVQNICVSGTVANLITTPTSGYNAEWYASATSTTVLTPTTALANGNLFVQQKSSTYAATLVSNVGTNVRWVKKLNDSTLVFFNAASGHLKSIKINGTGLTTLQTGLTTLSGMDVANDGNIYYTQGKQLKKYDVSTNNTTVIYDINTDGSLPDANYTIVQSSLTWCNADDGLKFLRYRSASNSTEIIYAGLFGGTTAYSFPTVSNVKAIEVLPSFNSVYVSSAGELKNSTTNTVIGTLSSLVDDVEYRDSKLYFTHNNQLKRMDADLNPSSIVVLNNTLTDDYGDIDVTSEGTIFLGSPSAQKIHKLNETVSNRIPVKIKVNNPTAPTVGSLSACFGATVADLTATGQSGAIIKWYAASTGGTVLTGTTALATGTTYYASQTIAGCESATRAAATPTIQPITPAPTTNTNTTYCAGSALDQVTMTGSGIKWYDAATGGSLLVNTTTFMTANTHYYASQTVNGCESPTRLDFVPQLINSTQSITSTQGASVCGPITASNFTLSATGTGTISWFANANLTSYEIYFGIAPDGTGNTHVLTGVTSTTTKYVSAFDGTCYSYPRVPVTVSVNVTPPVGLTSVDYVLTGNCAGSQTLTFDSVINGKNRYIINQGPATSFIKFDGTKWVLGNNINSTIFAQNTNAPAGVLPPATGWVILDAGCSGTFSLTNFVNQTVSNTYCTGATLADVVAAGTQNLKWYDAATGGTLLPNTTAMVAGIHYYVTQTVNGCESPTRYDLVPTINAGPTLTISTNPSNAIICNGSTITLTGSGATTYTWSGSVSNGVAFTPSANGTYTLTATDASGCAGVAVSSVTVNVSPNVSVNSGAICTGASFTLSGTGATSYTYSSGSNIVTPTSTSAYTVTGTDASGCSGVAVSNVTVNALPNISATTNNTLLCVGQSASLTASGGSTYAWSNSASGAVIAVSPTATTVYTVTGTDVNGCVNSTTIQQTVSVCTSIDNLALNASANLVVYPNPNNGVFIIETNTTTNIELVDVLGKTILKQQLEAGRYDINIANYANGIYFLKTATKTIRVVKQ